MSAARGLIRLSIRARVVILVCVAALPLFVLALYEAKDGLDKARDQARQDALLMARTYAALQAGVFNQTRFLLSGLAAAGPFVAGSDAGRHCAEPLKRIVAANPAHFNAAFVDLHGDLYCSARPLAGPVNVAQQEYFRGAIAQKRFSMSGLVTRADGRPLVVAAQPLIDDAERVRAVVVAALDAARLMQVSETTPAASRAVIVLADREARIVARFPDVPEFRGKVIPGLQAHLDVIGRTAEGYLDYVGLGGTERVAAYAALPDGAEWPLFVVAGIPRKDVERDPQVMLWRTLSVLVPVLLIALALAFFGAQRLLVMPLRQLASAAARFESGDLTARSGIEHEAGEIGALARSFDRLAAQNQRIVRALKALSAGNRTLLREKEETALMMAMCRVAVEHAGYRLALVNYVQHDERKSVRSVARAGHDAGFVESLDLTWADTDRGRGSVGTAIRTGKACVIHRMASDPRFAPWREAARDRGFGSIASFPLLVEGVVIGTFSIIASEEDAFDHDELQLLDEMAADLSFGIEVLRSNARRVAAEERAHHLATHDRLTGLPGRIPFLRALEAAIRRASESGSTMAVIAVHLSNLQELHDSLGFVTVNAATLESAARLKFAMSPAKELSQLASDDFAMIVAGADAASCSALARRLHALFDLPIDSDGAPVEVRAAFGATLFPQHGADPDVLLRRAGIAAREAMRRQVPFFLYEGGSERENPERLQLAAELRRAIAERALVVHLQPKVELARGGVRGAEALVRWPHARRGLVPPLEFVPIAEQTGLIRPMTSLVIDLAVAQLAAQRALPRPIPIAVNLSQRNLHDPGLVEHIERLLREQGIGAHLLEFEVTESALADDPQQAREVLGRLRALGCKLYIDDFGTGYSSLSYLVSLPVDAIKIDRSFVRQMAKSQQAHAVVASILHLARELGLQTVAEGVETREDASAPRRSRAAGLLFRQAGTRS
jgi:diguanylate cyclase